MIGGRFWPLWHAHFCQLATIGPWQVSTCKHVLGLEGRFQCAGPSLACEHLNSLSLKIRLCCRTLLVFAGASGLTQLADRHDPMLAQT